MEKTKPQLESELKKAISDSRALEEEVKLLIRRLDEQQELEKHQDADLRDLMADLKNSSATGAIDISKWPTVMKHKEALEKTRDFIRITRNALSIGTARLGERVEAADALTKKLKTFGKLLICPIGI